MKCKRHSFRACIYCVIPMIPSRPRYLSEGFLPVIFQVFGVDIEVVVVDSEGLGTLSDTRNKLLHFQ